MSSRQEVQVYQIVKASPRWLDNREIAKGAGTHERTAIPGSWRRLACSKRRG